eukprot:TRINITY_DN28778_c0_g1_i1.p1 TRINITY_DN28778_c0_g1~~TRINITY_DN28778_c0_g1_i1.p1  ORF type:complete len:464 (-),score=93.11 TRINITY_DN28778_c0_g1_i1:7-1209(-)
MTEATYRVALYACPVPVVQSEEDREHGFSVNRELSKLFQPVPQQSVDQTLCVSPEAWSLCRALIDRYTQSVSTIGCEQFDAPSVQAFTNAKGAALFTQMAKEVRQTTDLSVLNYLHFVLPKRDELVTEYARRFSPIDQHQVQWTQKTRDESNQVKSVIGSTPAMVQSLFEQRQHWELAFGNLQDPSMWPFHRFALGDVIEAEPPFDDIVQIPSRFKAKERVEGLQRLALYIQSSEHMDVEHEVGRPLDLLPRHKLDYSLAHALMQDTLGLSLDTPWTFDAERHTESLQQFLRDHAKDIAASSWFNRLPVRESPERLIPTLFAVLGMDVDKESLTLDPTEAVQRAKLWIRYIDLPQEEDANDNSSRFLHDSLTGNGLVDPERDEMVQQAKHRRLESAQSRQ